jgi:predicted hydrocarbon binding protein
MEDVLGKSGLVSVLSFAQLDGHLTRMPPDDLSRTFDFAALANLAQALEEMYGTRGGRGMSLRIGRAAFAAGFKRFGAMAGMADPAFQALPLELRTHLGAQALAAIFTNFSDQQMTLEDHDTVIELATEYSPFAWGRTSERPVCNTLVGIIQESMRWASQGLEYHVQETHCRAAGDARCVFRINKKPIGALNPAP